MPNIESARKRVRQSAKRRERNRAAKSGVNTARKQVLDAIESGNKAEAAKSYVNYSSTLDKAAKKGILKANTADRKKARLQASINAMA
jgi:small subunit ribosomal protein S20